MHFDVCDSEDRRTGAGPLTGRVGCPSIHGGCLRTRGAWGGWRRGEKGGAALSTDTPRECPGMPCPSIMQFHGAGCGFWGVTLAPRGHCCFLTDSREPTTPFQLPPKQKIITENPSHCDRAALPRARLLLLRIPGTVLPSPGLPPRASLLPQASISECPLGAWASPGGTRAGMVSTPAEPCGSPVPRALAQRASATHFLG